MSAARHHEDRAAASGTPVYLQIADELAAQIESGEFEAHAALPTERELCERWEVARMTVRHGLDLLERRGLIYRRHGVGTFVSEPKLVQNAVRLTGFFEQTLGQGFVPQSKVLRARQLASGRLLARALDIRVGQAVYEIVRLRSARGVPVVLETSNFPAARFSGLLGFDLARASIYRLMDEHFGGRPVEADQSIEAIAVDPADAELLQIPTGSPVMRLERLARDVTGRPVEHAIDIYRADRSRFTTSLKL